jgi:hypothetical protein
MSAGECAPILRSWDRRSLTIEHSFVSASFVTAAARMVCAAGSGFVFGVPFRVCSGRQAANEPDLVGGDGTTVFHRFRRFPAVFTVSTVFPFFSAIACSSCSGSLLGSHRECQEIWHGVAAESVEHGAAGGEAVGLAAGLTRADRFG